MGSDPLRLWKRISATDTPTESPIATTEFLGPGVYTDPSQPVEKRIEDLLARMTLDEKIGRATAEEMLATGIPLNFAPVVAVVQDVSRQYQ